MDWAEVFNYTAVSLKKSDKISHDSKVSIVLNKEDHDDLDNQYKDFNNPYQSKIHITQFNSTIGYMKVTTSEDNSTYLSVVTDGKEEKFPLLSGGNPVGKEESH